MFHTILIANRGEIAVRIIRTARRLGLRSVAVFSEADAAAMHVREADEAHPIGPAPAAQSYLRGDVILDVARRAGAQAIHPGYGFLSENADFAQACADAGITFIGPPPAAIRAMGSKAESKRLMVAAGVPTVPGYHGEEQDDALLAAEAARIGFPVLIKASAGGGGKGMRPVLRPDDFAAELAGARREAKAAFGDDRMLLEKYLQRPRHVEVQVFGDSQGRVTHLHTRDCSLQRRHQKVIEEAPAPNLSAGLRARMHEAAENAARAVGYTNAGTVEFIVEGDDAFFLEMNTRLQVEHPVTEMITGLDLVEWQLRVAAEEALPEAWPPEAQGHAVEARLYAEDPSQDFRPSVGRLSDLWLGNAAVGADRRRLGAGVPAGDTESSPRDATTFEVTLGPSPCRIDAGVAAGDTISSHYDPMIAKLIAAGRTRDGAFDALEQMLRFILIRGVATNQAMLRRLLRSPEVRGMQHDTGFIARNAGFLLAPEPDATGDLVADLAVDRAARYPSMFRSTSGPWQNLTFFRIFGMAEMAFAFKGPGRTHRAVARRQAEGWAVEVDGLDVGYRQFRGAGRDMVLVDGAGSVRKMAEPAAERADDLWRLMLDDEPVILEVVDPYAPAGEASGAENRLAAPIPGRVVQVSVAAGDVVKRGDTLVILEAMKTEIRIAAPRDGVIEALGCAAGDSVDAGAELVSLVA